MQFQLNPFQIASSPKICQKRAGIRWTHLDIIQNYYKRMRLLLSIFAIIFIAGAHQARKIIVDSGRQSHEGEEVFANREMVGVVKTSSFKDGVNIESSDEKMGSNLRIVEGSTPIAMLQPTIQQFNGSQQANNKRKYLVERGQQDYHTKVSDNHLRSLSSKETNDQQQTQSIQPQNTFYLDDQYLGTSAFLRKSIKLGTFEQQAAMDNRVNAQNSDNQQKNVKTKKTINMGLAQNDDNRSRGRPNMIIRIEPDSQQPDNSGNILKVYQNFRLRRQKLIQHKISFLQGSLPKSTQAIKTTNKQQEIWLYCLIAALALVVALPLLIALFKKQPQIEPQPTSIIKEDIPKREHDQCAAPFSR